MRGMTRGPGRIAFVAAIAALAVALANAGGQAGAGPALERDRDCSDFGSQAAAQGYFDDNGGSPSNNFDALDGDGDGVACESSPCPCAKPGEGDGGPGGGDGGSGGGPKKQGVRVMSVTDGDTIDVWIRGSQRAVRLIGIDTPEVYPEAECGGTEAADSMRQLLSAGDRVKLIRDRTQDNRDVYGRLLRYVERQGRDVGRKQINRGWARVYVFDAPFRRVGSYRRNRNEARRDGRGAWDRCGGKFRRAL